MDFIRHGYLRGIHDSPAIKVGMTNILFTTENEATVQIIHLETITILKIEWYIENGRIS